MSGPAAKLIFMLRPYRLLNAASISESPLRPPKVCAPAMKTSSSSFFAPAISDSTVSAARRGGAVKGANASSSKLSCVDLFTHHIMIRLRSAHLKFAWDGLQHIIFRGIADGSYRVVAILHRLYALPEHATEQDHAFIRYAEMFAAAVENRSLTFLSAAILIAASDPAGLVVPPVFSRNAVAQSLLRLVLRHLRRHFAVDDRREVKRKVHRVGVIDGDAPAQRLVTLVGRSECRGVVFVQVIADFVHIRHQKVAHRHERALGDRAGEGVADAELGDLGGQPLVGPQASFGRAVEPLEVMLIDAVFDGLQKIAVDQPRRQRAHAVFANQHIPARQ